MICPKCGKSGVKYLIPRPHLKKEDKRNYTRTDFRAKCKCGWYYKIKVFKLG